MGLLMHFHASQDTIYRSIQIALTCVFITINEEMLYKNQNATIIASNRGKFLYVAILL